MIEKLEELAALTSFRLSGEKQCDWTPIEARLGFSFPTEYKAYVQHFPPGIHRNGLHVLHPQEPGENGPEQMIPRLARMFQELAKSPQVRDGPTARSTYSFYPEPGGLIPWLTFDALAALCWLPVGDDPDRWPVVGYSDTRGHEHIDGTTLEALLRVIRGEAGHAVFPAQMYSEPLEFEPWDPRDFGLDPDHSG